MIACNSGNDLGLFVCLFWLLKLCINFSRSDESDDELADSDISKILIVTQTPPAYRKHPGGDRTGDYVPRSKMTSELFKIINDGLYYYEQDLWEETNKVVLRLVFRLLSGWFRYLLNHCPVV